jgi:hypothetical protein
MGDRELLMTDFAFGQEFRLFGDASSDGYVVEDVVGHAVAFLPRRLGGEVRTRTQRWDVNTERRRHGWALIARTIPDGAEAGGVTQRLLPNSYRLWIPPDTAYRLIQNPLNDAWTVRDGHSRLVRLTELGTFAAGSLSSGGLRSPLGTIKTFDGPITPVPLGLTIVLALEMIKANALIPIASAPSGSY